MDKKDEIIARLKEALRFYADPSNYFAIGFFPDPPCGAFMDDFSDDHGDEFFDRRMPGALARQTLHETALEILADKSCEIHQTRLVVGHAEFCPLCEDETLK